MAITTLDQLIERLQQSRDAAGQDLPLRLKIAVPAAPGSLDSTHYVVSTSGLVVIPCVSDSGQFIQLGAAGVPLG
jgi:hypothetical protein